MNKYVADTMSLILRLENRKLPQKVKDIYQDGENGKVEVHIPAIVFAEIAYLSENKRIEADLLEVKEYIRMYPTIMEVPLSLAIVEQAFLIYDIPELHDRLIAATGKTLDASILTNDPEIIKSVYVNSIWK